MLRSAFILAAILILAAIPVFSGTVVFDFASGDSGSFSAADPPVSPMWTFSGTDWRVGSGSSVSSTLVSSTMVATGDPIVVTFSHITNFENGWDGGMLAYQAQGSPSVQVASFIAGGYNDSSIVGSFPTTGTGAPGFTASYTFNSIAEVGSLAAGTQFVLRFEAAWDGSVQRASPNWRILSVAVSGVQTSETGIPEPATFSLLPGGAAFLFFARKRLSAG